MHTRNQTRKYLIEMAFASRPDAIVEVSIQLWKQLTPELISIIGEGGFKPLYVKSIRTACVQFPNLMNAIYDEPGDERFEPLRRCLLTMNNLQATAASLALMDGFLETLALLIGEVLTSQLLYVAWHQETFKTFDKDFPK